MRGLALLVVVVAVAGCGRSARKSGPDANAIDATGLASWYGPRFHGRQTANGEIFDRHALTAAHRKLRFGTCVRVRNEANGNEVEVRINDRGPYAGGRIIDVSEAAAEKLGMIEKGVARVRLSACR